MLTVNRFLRTPNDDLTDRQRPAGGSLRHTVEVSDLIFGLTLTSDGESLVDRIENTLSDAIRRGTLPSGHRLREVPIAERFGCSTTPVREAIRRLASAGLVEVLPRRGAIVSTISVGAIHELYELRLLVEPTMARRAAASAADHPEMIETLRGLVGRQSTQADTGDLNEGRLDAAFHAAIARLAGNETIAEHVAHATQRIEAVQARAQKWAPKGVEEALHFHSEILDAIIAADEDRAETIMHEHLIFAERGVLDGLGHLNAEEPSTEK